MSAIHDEEQRELEETCERLAHDALAKAIFIVNKDGQLIVMTGETAGIDTTGMASLIAGSTAATGGLAQMLGEEEFPVHFHEGEKTHVHVSVVSEDLILVVIFDERSSLGLVRLRVKRAHRVMAEIDKRIQEKAGDNTQKLDLFGGITEEDIDSLFGDAF